MKFKQNFFSIKMKRIRIFILLTLLIATFLISRFLDGYLESGLEKSAYIWNYMSRQNQIPSSDTEYFFFGDSQMMSGIHPLQFQKEMQLDKDKVFFFPRPSEQPEGIHLLINKFLPQKDLSNKTIVLNISPITVTKNGLLDSHRSLLINFGNFESSLLTEPSFHSFYLKTAKHSFHYILLQFFPNMRNNSYLLSEYKLLPSSTKLDLTQKNIEYFLNWNPFMSISDQIHKNAFIRMSLEQNQNYWQWDYFSESENSCQISPIKFPEEARFAFQDYRPKAVEEWTKIIQNLDSRNARVLLVKIPFSLQADTILQTQLKSSPIELALSKLVSKIGEKNILRISNSELQENDFVDYVHPNLCGAKKITHLIAEKFR